MKIGFADALRSSAERWFVFESKEMRIEATKLSVIPSLAFGPGYAIHNKYKNGRIVQIEPNYIPADAESYEQGLAFIVFGIGLYEERNFGILPDWYILGKEYKSYLPWEIEREKERKEFEAMPKVQIEIAWMRVMVKMLKSWRGLFRSDKISIHFDGSFLRFTCRDKELPIPGRGKAWDEMYIVDSSFLDGLPQRINRNRVVFRIQGEELNLGNTLFKLIGRKPVK